MRAPRLIVGLAALAALAAGCGSEAAQEAAERSPDPVVAAAGKAADEETAGVSISVEAGGQTFGGEGVVDLVEGNEGRLTFTAPGPAPTTMEMRIVDGEVFMQVPGLEQQQPGKRWIKVDPEAAAGSGQPADALGTQNPTDVIGLVESATDFEEDGTTTVRGEEMARWSGTLDLAEATDDQEAAQRLRDMGLETLPAEVAIDDDDRLRQVRITMDLAAAAGAAGQELPPDAPTEMVFTVELFDFGAAVDVEAPPADEVVEGAATGISQPTA